MEIAPINVPLTFEVTYDRDDLSIGLSIYDCTTGTPVLVEGPDLMQNVVGTTYIGQYTALVEGKSCLVFKAVYTDDTLDTLDDNYSQASESFVTQDSSGGGGGGGGIAVVGYVNQPTSVVGLVNC